MRVRERLRARWTAFVLAGLLLVGLVVRLQVMNIPGHGGDIAVIARWAARLAQYGPWDFYDHDSSVYPLLLYFYWPLGVLFRGDALLHAVKGLSIPFDLALAIVLYAIARRLTTDRRALLAPALYLLNPAVLLAGPIWGQVDAAGALAYVAALWVVAADRSSAAGALAVLAALAKPQFGLVALPVIATAILRGRRGARWRPLALSGLGAFAAYVVVALPLRLTPALYVEQVRFVGSEQRSTSLNAPNPWGMLIGYKIPDGGLFWVGAGLLLIGLAVALLPLWRRRDLPTILAVGLFVVFAFYFLPTRVHERYLFPAMAVLAPLAAANWRVLGLYLILTAAFALTLMSKLVTTPSSRFSLPPDLEHLLVQRTAVVWSGLIMLGVVAALVVLLIQWPLRSAPSAPRD
jgi:Gpi18-like mannosyltransferase